VKSALFAVTVCFCAQVFSQPLVGPPYVGPKPVRTVEVFVSFMAGTEGPKSPLSPFGQGSFRETEANGDLVIHRYVRYLQTFTGYDLVLERRAESEAYLATFQPLSIDPVAAASHGAFPPGIEVLEKGQTPIFPAARLVHTGDRLRLELATLAERGGERVVDEIDFSNLHTSVPIQDSVVVSAPSVPARNFTPDDLDLRIGRPRIEMNGEHLASLDSVIVDTLPFLYVPGRGRYVFSISPRTDLGFVKAGEVERGTLTFSFENDTITLRSYEPIAPGDSKYYVYVFLDPEFQPTSLSQRNRLILGSVSPAELSTSQLKR
jgi:hypothetical protein